MQSTAIAGTPRPSQDRAPHPSTTPNGSRDSLIIIPTYDEAGNLEALVPTILAAGPFDILVIDDNSPDGTGRIADELASRYPTRVDVVHRPGKLGLGSAYVAGFGYALARGYERIFEMDADFSHDPATLSTLQAALDDADVVIGSRYVPGGGSPGWPVWRRLLSRAGSAYAARVLDLPFRDLTSGFKGFRRRALAALDLGSVRSNGYSFQVEMTYRCYRNGFAVAEVPIVFHQRRQGRSKLAPYIVIEALLVVWRLRRGAPEAEART